MKETTATVTRRTRNRVQTCQNILTAFGQVLMEDGLKGVGVNRIAEIAGVSKVLIYRYFGGLDGLAQQYVLQSNLFPHSLTSSELAQSTDKNQARLSCWHLLSTFHLIRQQPQAQELLKALVSEDDELSEAVSETLEREMTQFAERFHLQSPIDSQAVAAVLMGAMTYLTLLSNAKRSMVGIDLSNDSSWHRIETAITVIFEGLYSISVSDMNKHGVISGTKELLNF